MSYAIAVSCNAPATMQKIVKGVDTAIILGVITLVALMAISHYGTFLLALQQTGYIYAASILSGAVVLIVIADILAYFKSKKHPNSNHSNNLDSKIQPQVADPFTKGTDLEKEGSVLNLNTKSLSQVSKTAIVYMSISGNPAHLGHIMALKSAIEYLRSNGYENVKAKISVSWQSYVNGKINGKNASIKDESKKFVTFNHQERKDIVQKVIKFAQTQNLIKQDEIEFWDDQAKKDQDYPESYKELEKKNKNDQIFLVCGSDFGMKMYDNKIIHHAIIFTRGNGDPDANVIEDENGTLTLCGKEKLTYKSDGIRRIILKSNPGYTEFSSTAIQKGEIQMPTDELQKMLEDARKKQIGSSLYSIIT